jgi:ubiquinone/menaquinone biosynthesis C-methylase UbiE
LKHTVYLIEDAEEATRVLKKTAGMQQNAATMVGRMLSTVGVDSGRILEISCAGGTVTATLAKEFPVLRIAATERSPALADVAERALCVPELAGRVEFRRSDGDRLPFDDNTFDAVIGFGVGTAVERPEVLFQEVARVLKPTGRMLLVFPLRTWKALYRRRLRYYLSSSEIRRGLRASTLYRACRLA